MDCFKYAKFVHKLLYLLNNVLLEYTKILLKGDLMSCMLSSKLIFDNTGMTNN